MNSNDDGAPRWFFCLPLESDEQANLARLQASCVARLRWASPRWAHLTLRFLGPLPETTGRTLARKLADSNETLWPAVFDLTGAGSVSRLGRDAWAVRLSPSSELTCCHRAVSRLVREAGLPPEGRALLPHVTLGRGAGTSRTAAELALFSTWSFSVRAVELRTSLLATGGARYAVIARRDLTLHTTLSTGGKTIG